MIDDGYELLTGMGRDYDRDKFVSSSSCVYGDGSILIKRISRILSILFFFFFFFWTKKVRTLVRILLKIFGSLCNPMKKVEEKSPRASTSE